MTYPQNALYNCTLRKVLQFYSEFYILKGYPVKDRSNHYIKEEYAWRTNN